MTKVTVSDSTITVIDNSTPKVVIINSLGPQGSTGSPGTVGPSINTGSFVTTSSFNTYTSSINNFTSSINNFTSSINNATSSFVTTGSNSFDGNQTITGSLTVTGNIDGNIIAKSLYSYSEANTIELTPSLEEYILFHGQIPSQIEQGITYDISQGYSRFIINTAGIYEITYKLCMESTSGADLLTTYLVNTSNTESINVYENTGIFLRITSQQQYYTQTIQLLLNEGEAFSVATFTEGNINLKGFATAMVKCPYASISVKMIGIAL
jgi:hypothetical protein